MEPGTYCQQAMDELRAGKASNQQIESQQRIVVLAYFAEVQPAPREFPSQLRLLAESSERIGRQSLAAAARAVLSDWEARSGTASKA